MQPWTYCLVCLYWSMKDTCLQLMLCFEACACLNCQLQPTLFYGNSGTAGNCIPAASSLDRLQIQKQPVPGRLCSLVLGWQYLALPLEVGDTVTRQRVHNLCRHPLKRNSVPHALAGYHKNDQPCLYLQKVGQHPSLVFFPQRNIVTHTCLNQSSKLNCFLAQVPVALGRQKELPSRVCGI